SGEIPIGDDGAVLESAQDVLVSVSGSSRNLLFRREVSTPFRARKHFVRVAATVRIEDPAQRSHGVEIIARKLFLHKINLFNSNAVLPGHAATEFDALFQNVMACSQRATDLVRIP